MATVIIIDDHPMIRLATKLLVEQDGHRVIANANNALEGVQRILALHPEMVVLDIDLPPFDGIEVVKRVRGADYCGKILMMTGKHDIKLVRRSIDAGANGFVYKSNDYQELSAAVQAVDCGYSYFPMLDAIARPALLDEERADETLSLLTRRERQIIMCLAKGMKNKDIAYFLNISHKTVSAHKVNLMQKLGLTNEMKIAEFIVRNNLG